MQKQATFDKAYKTQFPKQTVIVVAKDKDGKPNPITIGWVMFASSQPPMLAIGVYKGQYSVKCIRHSKCFTLVYPSSEMTKATLFYGEHSGRDIDKFKEFPTKTSPAKKIDSLLLTDAVANFECRLFKQIPTGDHIIFIGKVVCAHMNTAKKKRLYSVGPGHRLGAI